MKVGYRLSPNEEVQLLQAERERRRKVRLLQVREQAKHNAARVRNAVKEEKNRQLNKLAEEVKVELERHRQERLQQLTDLYVKTASGVGKAHREAVAEVTHPKHRMRVLRQKSDLRVANERHKVALQHMKEEREERERESSKSAVLRQTALETERARSALIVSLPQPSPDPIDGLGIEKAPTVKPVRCTDLNAFSATHYHIPEPCIIEKAEPTEQGNAKEAAEEEGERLRGMDEDRRRVVEERREKARLRHKHAFHKELIKQDYNKMLLELSDLQRADMQRRQKVVAKIPKQIFEPPHRHLEEKQEEQRDMEEAFENMFMAATDYMGDMSMALDPHPPPETPSTTASLDISRDIEEGQGEGEGEAEGVSDPQSGQPSETPRDDTVDSQVRRRPLVGAGMPPGGALKKLLNKIKGQRDEWVHRSASSDTGGSESTPSIQSSEQEFSGSSRHFPTRPATDPDTLSSGVISTSPVQSTTQTEVTEESSTPSTLATLETGTIVSSSAVSQDATSTAAESGVSDRTLASSESEPRTLRHPLEAAARLRSQPMKNQQMSATLLVERRRQDQVAAQSMQLKRDTEQQQRDWELQKRLLQERLDEIESRRRMLASQLTATSSLSIPTSVTSASSTALSSATDPSSMATEPLPRQRVQYWPSAMATAQTWPQQPIRQYPSAPAATEMLLQSQDTSTTLSPDEQEAAPSELRGSAAGVGGRKTLLLEEARQRLQERAQKLFQEASTLLKTPSLSMTRGTPSSDGQRSVFERMSDLGQFHDVEISGISGTTVEQTLSSEASLSPNNVGGSDRMPLTMPAARTSGSYWSTQSGHERDVYSRTQPVSLGGRSADHQQVAFSQALSNFDQREAKLETQLRHLQEEKQSITHRYQDVGREPESRDWHMEEEWERERAGVRFAPSSVYGHEHEDTRQGTERDDLMRYMEQRQQEGQAELYSNVDSSPRSSATQDSSVVPPGEQGGTLRQSRPPPALHRQWPSTPHELSMIVEAETPGGKEARQQHVTLTDKPTGPEATKSQSGYHPRQTDSAVFSMTSGDTPRSGDILDDQRRDVTRRDRPLPAVYQTDSAVFSTTSGDTYQSGGAQQPGDAAGQQGAYQSESGVFSGMIGVDTARDREQQLSQQQQQQLSQQQQQQLSQQHTAESTAREAPGNVQTYRKPFLATLESFYGSPSVDDDNADEDNEDDIDIYMPHPDGITVASLPSDTSRSTAADSSPQWTPVEVASQMRSYLEPNPSRETQYAGSPQFSPALLGESPNFGDISGSSLTPLRNPTMHYLPLSSTPAAGRSVRMTGEEGGAFPSFPSSPCVVEDKSPKRTTQGKSVSFRGASGNLGEINWTEFLSLKLKEMAAEHFTLGDSAAVEPATSRYTPQPAGGSTGGLQQLSANAHVDITPSYSSLHHERLLTGQSSSNEQSPSSQSTTSSQATLPTDVMATLLQADSPERSECPVTASDTSATNLTDLSEYTISGESDTVGQIHSQMATLALMSAPPCDLTQYSIQSDSTEEQGKQPSFPGNRDGQWGKEVSSQPQGTLPQTTEVSPAGSMPPPPPPLSLEHRASTPKLLPDFAQPASGWTEPAVMSTRRSDEPPASSTTQESLRQDGGLVLTEDKFFEALVEDSTGITDEPDLTLVSLNSTAAGQGDDASLAAPTSEENISSSLMSFIQHERSVDSGSPHGGATGQADSPTVAVAASDSRSVIPGRLRDVGGDIGLTSGRIVKEGRGVFEVLGGESGSGTDDGKEEDRIVSIPVFHTEGDSSDSFVGLSLADAFEKRRRQFIAASQQRKEEAHAKAKARLEATQRAAPIRFQKQPKTDTRKKPAGSHSPTRKITVAKTGSGAVKPVKRKPKAVTYGRTAVKLPAKKPGASGVSSGEDTHVVVAPKVSCQPAGKGEAPVRGSVGARAGMKAPSVGSSSGKTQQKQLGKMLATWKRSRTGTNVPPK